MSLAAGTRLEQYEVIAPLGSGGMGEVYRARDTTLGREVAIKVLPERTATDPEALERFEREAKALAALSHPNILSIFDFGRSNEITYAVMELLEGETLRSRILRSPVPAAKIIEIGMAIAEGLAAAHSRGIVHRDLKPENIFITSGGSVKILDFGLARLEAPPHSKGESEIATVAGTEPGTVIGTIGYMSPEQVRGQSLDSRTDIFSLGCILYEMATRECPFARNTAADTMAAILNYEPPEIAAKGKEIPPELDRVILHCLEKKPDDRFQSARDLSFDLKEIGSGIRLTRPVPVARVSPFRIAKSLIVLIVVVLALAALWWFTRSNRLSDTGERIPVAVADFVNETGEKDLDGLSGMLITSLEQSRRLAVMTRSRMLDVLKQMGKEKSESIDEHLGREICKQANVHALILASIRKFDQLYMIDLKVLDPEKNEYLFTTKEQATGKASVPEMIDKLSEQTRRGLNEKVAEIQAASRKVTEVTTSNLQAYQHFFKGEELINKLEFKEAEEEFRKAIDIDPTFALAHWRLGYAISWSNMDRARESLQNSIRYKDKLPEKEKIALQATRAYVERDLEEAFKQLNHFLALYPEEKEALFTMGDWLYHQGDVEKAEEYFKRVLVLDPNFERALQHLTWTFNALGQYDNAVLTAQTYVNRTHTPEAYIQLFNSYKTSGDLDQALQLTYEAEKQFPEAKDISRGRAEIYTLRLEYDRSEKECRQMLTSGREADIQRNGYGCLTDLYVYSGRFRDAIQAKQKQIDLEIQSNDMESIADHYADIAYIALWGLNDAASANQALSTALSYEGKINGVPHALFDTLTLAGRLDDAIRVGQKYLWGHRPFWEISLRANRSLQEKDLAGAAKDFKVLSQRSFPYERAYALYRLSVIYDEMKAYDQAIEALQTYLSTVYSKTTWEYPKTLYLLASLYDKKGNAELAKEFYRKFLDVWRLADPNLPEVIAARKALQ